MNPRDWLWPDNPFLRVWIVMCAAVVMAATAIALSAPPKVKEANTLTGFCTRCLDGDTIDVLCDKTAYRIRLYGIDAPELRGQPHGQDATKRCSELCFGKKVKVHVVKQDNHDRTVGKVELPDGSDLSETLVKDGWAHWYEAYAKRDTKLRELQDEARKARRGLWKDKEPIEPWKWRKGEREPHAGGRPGLRATDANRSSSARENKYRPATMRPILPAKASCLTRTAESPSTRAAWETPSESASMVLRMALSSRNNPLNVASRYASLRQPLAQVMPTAASQVGVFAERSHDGNGPSHSSGSSDSACGSLDGQLVGLRNRRHGHHPAFGSGESHSLATVLL